MKLIDAFENDIKRFRNIRRFFDFGREIVQKYSLKYFHYKKNSANFPSEKLSLFNILKEETEDDYNAIVQEGKLYFYYAYEKGLGHYCNARAIYGIKSKFDQRLLNFFPLSNSERKTELVFESLNEFIEKYEIPIKIIKHKNARTESNILRHIDKNGFFKGLNSVSNLSDVLSVYVTDILGICCKDSRIPANKDPEDFYGMGNKDIIVMTLGEQKDLSNETIQKASKHEFIHMLLGGGQHHDGKEIYIPRKSRKYFNEEEHCVFASNMALDKRSHDPCSFLDYELRMRVQGFKDRLGI